MNRRPGDRFAAELADETIMMTPPHQSLPFKSEGNAGNTDRT